MTKEDEVRPERRERQWINRLIDSVPLIVIVSSFLVIAAGTIAATLDRDLEDEFESKIASTRAVVEEKIDANKTTVAEIKTTQAVMQTKLDNLAVQNLRDHANLERSLESVHDDQTEVLRLLRTMRIPAGPTMKGDGG